MKTSIADRLINWRWKWKWRGEARLCQGLPLCCPLARVISSLEAKWRKLKAPYWRRCALSAVARPVAGSLGVVSAEQRNSNRVEIEEMASFVNARRSFRRLCLSIALIAAARFPLALPRGFVSGMVHECFTRGRWARRVTRQCEERKRRSLNEQYTQRLNKEYQLTADFYANPYLA